MKTIKTILIVFSSFLLYAFANAQGNCQGGNVWVYQGAKGCGCHCLKECVTPEELPVYLANGWNTNGCWNCCKAKNYVDARIPKTSLDEIRPNAEPGSLTVAFTLASASDVNIELTDMSGRLVATVVDEYREDLDNALIWDDSGISPGIYLLHFNAGAVTETKMISIME